MAKKVQKLNPAKDVLARIDERRMAMTPVLSDRKLSLLATGSAHTLGSIRKQIKKGTQVGFGYNTVANFARVLNAPIEWLMTGKGSPEVDAHQDSATILGHDAPEDTINVIGYAHAAGIIDRYPEGASLDTVPRPAGATRATVAVEVRGTSLGKLLNRWLAYYDDVRDPITQDLFGKLCVVETEDGGVYVKRVRPAKNNLFDLVPYEDGEPEIKGVKIKWAAKVNGFIAPR